LESIEGGRARDSSLFLKKILNIAENKLIMKKSTLIYEQVRLNRKELYNE